MNNKGAPHYSGDTYGTRLGAGAVTHTLPVAYNTTGVGSGVSTGLTIRASSAEPVQIEVSQNVWTAFNAASNNVLSAGTDSTANQWVATTSTTSLVAGYYPASNAVAKFRLTADTTIYVKYTQQGTAATTGNATLIVREYPENVATF